MDGSQKNGFDGEKESYAFIPGLGLIQENPQEKEKFQLRVVSNKIGMAMILYILLSSFLSVPVIWLLSVIGLPIQVDWDTGVFYGSATMQQIVNLIIMALRLGLPCLFLWRGMQPKVSIHEIMKPPRSGLTMAAIFIGLATSVVASYAVKMIQDLLVSFGFLLTSQTLNIPTRPEGILLYFILMVLLPAFLEELLFRGAIMQSLRGYGDGLAIVVSALLFALAHFSLINGSNAFVMGLVIGYFVIKTGSLWTGMLIHFFVNAIGFSEALLSVGVFEDYASDITLIINVILLVLGILVFAVVTLRDNTLFRIIYPSATSLATSERIKICLTSVAMLTAVAVLFVLSLSILQ